MAGRGTNRVGVMSEAWNEPHLQSNQANHDPLPKTATGKIRKFVLRAQARAMP
jgi:acyl-CoA synthetase (AMP-forming)/AMP-acid ligase II